LTTNETEAVRVRALFVPLIVSAYEPAAVALELVTMSWDDPGAATLEGAKLGVAPAGRPLTAKPTSPLKPLTAPTETA